MRLTSRAAYEKTVRSVSHMLDYGAYVSFWEPPRR